MITAPNSLIPLANIITKPDSILRQAKGNETVKNVLTDDAPKFEAAFSRRIGTASKPERAALIKKGRLTKAIAQEIEMGVPIRSNPALAAAEPIRELREMTPKIAMPAAV